jgi:D-lactate dehydrogenase
MEKNNKLLKLLKKIQYFSDINDSSLELLIEKMKPLVYKKDTKICKEGDTGDWMFIIESGEISVIKKGKDNIPIEVSVLQNGDIAGEMSLFGQQKRSATLVAKKDTKAWILDYTNFNKLLDENINLSKPLLKNLSKHLKKQSSVVAKLLSQDIDKRFKVAFFDSKPYMEKAFREQNHYNYKLQFFESRLSLDTVSLTAGFKVICIFVNDDCNKEVIDELKAMGIEMIALRCAGFNNVNLKACENNKISVARVPAYSPFAVAEHSIALMMALNRKIHRAHNRVRDSNFSLDGLVGFDMHEKTAGIIGAGKIGRCAINILKGYGCKLLIYSRTRNKQLEKETGAKFVGLDELTRKSDIISIYAPLTKDTYHMINEDSINKMKKGVMIINTSRGPLIDSKALLKGLKNGIIGYAGLDVYEEESAYFFEDYSDKIITDDLLARLTTFNNVIITSHQAFLTNEALRNIAMTTIENIHEFELGKRFKEITNHVFA